VIHALAETVSLLLIIGFTVLLTIGIHRAAPPSHDREAERRHMRDERRRPGGKQ